MTKWAYLAKGLEPPLKRVVQGVDVDLRDTWGGIAIAVTFGGQAKAGPSSIAIGLEGACLQAGDGGLLVARAFAPDGELRLEAARVGSHDGIKPDTLYYFSPVSGWTEVLPYVAPTHHVIKRKVSA